MPRSPGDNGSASEETELSLDAILDLLSHHHRRRMLQLLRDDTEEAVPQDELISELRNQEADRTSQQPSWDHLSAVLHHVHDPKLSEVEVISFDESEGVYHYHPDERLEKWLELIESEHESR